VIFRRYQAHWRWQADGNTAYRNGDYDTASSKYETALGYIEGLLHANASAAITTDMATIRKSLHRCKAVATEERI